jgi:hypothetical protein
MASDSTAPTSPTLLGRLACVPADQTARPLGVVLLPGEPAAQ